MGRRLFLLGRGLDGCLVPLLDDGNVGRDPGTHPKLPPPALDGLMDGLDFRKERFIFGVFSLLAVECLSPLGECVKVGLGGLLQRVELVYGVDVVLGQEFELFHIAVKLDDLVHKVAAFPRRRCGLFQRAQQIKVVIVQRPKACQLLGLALYLIPSFGWRRWPVVERRLLMGLDTLLDGLLGVVVPQGFQPHKPFLARRPYRYVLAQLDLIALLFEVGDEMLKCI